MMRYGATVTQWHPDLILYPLQQRDIHTPKLMDRCMVLVHVP